MMRKIKIRIGLIALLLLGMMVSNASADCASAVLDYNADSADVPWIRNDTSKQRLVGAVASASVYDVQYCVYKGTNSENCNVLHSKFVKSPGDSFDKSYAVQKKNYRYVSAKIYGNNSEHPRKNCYANAILSN